MYVVHVVTSEAQHRQALVRVAGTVYMLEPLYAPGPTMCFAGFDSLEAAAAESDDVFLRLLEVHGNWRGPVAFAVYAVWQLADERRAGDFLASRLAIGEACREHIPSFALEWVLQHVAEPGRFLCIGLYGEEAGLRQLRTDPAVVRTAQAESTATDLFGSRFFRLLP